MKSYLTVNTGNKERKVEVIRSRRKTISLIIRDEGRIEIRCSMRTSENYLLQFLEEKKDWIEESIRKQEKHDHLISTGSNGKYAFWLGKKYPVTFEKGVRNGMTVESDCIHFTLNQITEANIDQIFYKEATKKLAEMVMERRKDLDQKVCFANGFPIPRITLKYMTSRWGSCTPSKAHISLSVRLIHFPPECLDYVMVHEYCHFLVGNHSKDFYAEVEKLMPDYRKALEKLK